MEELTDARERLQSLFASQRLAVLATQSAGQPYSNLVAFAATNDLKELIFVTGRNTQKYANLKENKKMALLVDSRRNQVTDFQMAVAVTAIGTAEESRGEERDFLTRVYVAKHPDLAGFMQRPNSAVIKVTPSDYIVAGFDKTESLRLGD